MIQRPDTSTSVVLGGSVNPPRVPTDSMRPRRTTIVASGSGGPPLPSSRVAPTSATPSGGARRQLAVAASAARRPAMTNVEVRRMPSREGTQEGGWVARPMQDPLDPSLYLGR